jgi:hypothetical protein
MKNYILIFFLLTISCLESKAQSSRPVSKLSKGFAIGYDRTSFVIKENNWRQTAYKDTLNSISTEWSGGFTLGILLKVKLNQRFCFRPKFQFSFQQRILVYNKKNEMEKVKAERIFFDFPLHFIFQKGLGKYSPYILFGSTVRFGFQAQDISEDLYAKNFDFTGDIGFGLEIKLKDCVVAPEIFYSNGFVNLKSRVNNLYNNVLNSYKGRNISFTVNFRSI